MDSSSVNVEAAHGLSVAAPDQVSPSEPNSTADQLEQSEQKSSPLSELELRTQAAVMQDQLGFILTNIKEIKDNCKRLKTQNQSLQEYIESLMAHR